MFSQQHGDVPEAHWSTKIVMALVILAPAALIATLWRLATGG
jgi:hypothetical protein